MNVMHLIHVSFNGMLFYPISSLNDDKYDWKIDGLQTIDRLIDL